MFRFRFNRRVLIYWRDLMAGEKKGMAFEALTVLGLQSLGMELGKSVHWGVKFDAVSVDPDIVIGRIEKPTHWFLLTSTGSAKEFDKKFWRNVAELFEVKRFVAGNPIVGNFVFESNQLNSLRTAMSKLFDIEMQVLDRTYGSKLLDFVDENLIGLLVATMRFWNTFASELVCPFQHERHLKHIAKILNWLSTKSPRILI